MWSCYGKVEVFSLDNGLYIFQFNDALMRDEVLESQMWHIANKPIILHRWQPEMQLLKLALSSIPI